MLALGGQPMVWQTQVGEVGCELLPGGMPAYREEFDTVPRQQGKTYYVLARLLHRCLIWAGDHGPQLCAYTAQTGKDARNKWLDELVPLLRQTPFWQTIRSVSRANGQEAVYFKNGSIIKILPTSEEAGHGPTWRLVVLDEIWADTDNRREAAFRPGMIRVPDAQLLVCSTAGTAASTVYNRKRSKGRQAVGEDRGSGMSYAEWSADDDTWDPYDETSWAGHMPGVAEGIVSPDVIRLELESLDIDEFKRAYGNIPSMALTAVFPAEVWQQVHRPDAKPNGQLAFGLDVAEDRSSAAVVAYAGGTFELLKHRPGVEWVVDYCNQLTEKQGGLVTLDEAGPAGALAPKIKKARSIKSRQVHEACARLYDAVIQTAVRFRDHPAFDDAVKGAAQRVHADTWSWSRRSSTSDITPLVAATMAYDGADKKPRGIGAAWL